MDSPDTTQIDPFDTATEAKAPSAEYFGEIILDAWHCVLEKGTGKRPFDPQLDDPALRRTAVDIVILPLPEMNLKFNLERKLVAESKAWTNITWPSLQKLGLGNAREARNRFCKVRLAPTSRTWVGPDGEKKEETTFEFEELYADEAACKAAYATRSGHAQAPATGASATTPLPTVSAEDLARKTAFTFARAIVTSLARVEKDPLALQAKAAERIAGMPMINTHFSGESPEILQLIAEALS